MSEDTTVKRKGISKKKRNMIIAIISVIIIAFVFGINHLTSKHLYNGRIAKNIYIEDVDVSNLTKQEALDIVNAKYPIKNLKLSYNNEEYTINAKDVDLSYNTKQVVDEAYNLTREKSYLSNVMTYMRTKFGGHDLGIKVSYDEDKLDKEIGQVSKQINKKYVDATISVSGGITVKESQTGLKCDDETNKKAIEKAYKDKNYETVALKVDVTQPRVKTEDVKSIDTVLGSYSTTFNQSQYGRNYNITLALDRCDGSVVMPGETFSYNQVVGKRTIDAGYKEAGAYAGGKVIQEIGGGICQVSSTLYNAVLYADLEIVERSNHYFETSYVTTGRDATVSWGTVDFKFKNNRTYPIKIEAVAKNGINKISILGIKEEKEYEIVIQSKVTSIIEQEIKYENDYSIPYGEEEVEQQGHNGCTSKTYIIKKLNGATVSTEEITSDYYHALDKIIKKGMKR